MCLDPEGPLGPQRKRGRGSKRDDDLSERVKKALEEARQDVDAPRGGGLIVRTSSCCAAPVEYTQGGVIMPICSKCGGSAEEPRIGAL